MSVVVRFAPSPTGALHVGGVRTALYNYLFAKRHGGKCLLRIEDTDQTRFVPGAESYIIDSMRWVGIDFDEGPHIGGPHAPYRQSERTAIYQQYAAQLIREGKAYYAFDTQEALQAMREKALQETGNHSWAYGCLTRMQLENSLTLPEAEVKARLERGDAYVIRLWVPENETVDFVDEIRGEVSIHTTQIDDKVLLKGDGLPTYHLANVVDDYLMEVTHVIRGEEWLPSAPLHVLLYRAFGWAHKMPKFAHLPLILRPDGKGKLSKRDGDKLGIPVFPLNWQGEKEEDNAKGFKEAGFLPEALVNFLALLGWNPGNDEEVMTVARMAELFSLERIGKMGTRFDLEKLQWFNQTYIKQADAHTFVPAMRTALEEIGLEASLFSDDYMVRAANVMKERVTVVPDFVKKAPYLYTSPAYDSDFFAKKWNDAVRPNVAGLVPVWENIAENTWDAVTLQQALHTYTQANSIGNGNILPQLRLALTGIAGGPDSMMVAELLGKTETLARLQALLQK